MRSGDLAPSAFQAWLAQDYLYVGDLLTFQARLVARAPRSAQAVLVGGLVALEAELGWFEEHAQRLSIRLDVVAAPATLAYRAFLAELDGRPYQTAVTALWAMERAYLEAWRSAAPGAPVYREFVSHWATDEFEAYVGGLERAADAYGDSEIEAAALAFREVARLERGFWDMALAG